MWSLEHFLQGKEPVTFYGEGHSIRVCSVKIDPDMAQDALENANLRNRDLRESTVSKYTKRMIGGLWVPMSSIMYVTEREIFDGQHRLTAVVRSGKSQWFTLVIISHEQGERLMQFLDDPLPRGAKDFLHFHGVPNAPRVAALMQFEYSARINSGNPCRRKRAENQTLLHLYHECRDDLEHVWEHSDRKLPKEMRVPQLVLDWFIFSTFRISPEDAKTFLDALRNPVALPQSSPIVVVRRRLVDIYAKRKGSHQPLPAVEQLTLLNKAWNLWYAGEIGTHDNIKYRPQDSFPAPTGAQ